MACTCVGAGYRRHAMCCLSCLAVQRQPWSGWWDRSALHAGLRFQRPAFLPTDCRIQWTAGVNPSVMCWRTTMPVSRCIRLTDRRTRRSSSGHDAPSRCRAVLCCCRSIRYGACGTRTGLRWSCLRCCRPMQRLCWSRKSHRVCQPTCVCPVTVNLAWTVARLPLLTRVGMTALPVPAICTSRRGAIACSSVAWHGELARWQPLCNTRRPTRHFTCARLPPGDDVGGGSKFSLRR